MMLCNYVPYFLKPVHANIFKTPFRKYTPRRALLYVPADNLKKVLKAFMIDVDCILLDCEDSVVLGHKPAARLNIREILDKGRPDKKRKYDLAVKVNDAHGELLKQDLSVIVTGKHLPDTILLPKVNSASDIKHFAELLNEYVTDDKKVNLIIAVESPESLINLTEICKTAKNYKTSKFELVALLFGCDNYCSYLGIKRSSSVNELLYPRLKIVTVAKAFRLQAIDMVYNMYKDEEGLKKQAEEGVHLGYTGKQVLHPKQVEIVQNIFMPSAEDIKLAQQILKTFHKHQQNGEAFFLHSGQVVGMPVMRWAQKTVDLANALNMKK